MAEPSKKEQKREAENTVGVGPEQPRVPLFRFGRGVYGSKDVPVRLLDALIVLIVAAAIGLTVWGATRGGFTIEFDAGGADGKVAAQRVKHGQLVAVPETPVRPGYTLVCWSTDAQEEKPWHFTVDAVQTDMTLYAVWTPAEITVRFDLDGGTVNGADSVAPLTVVYGEAYGTLPVPEKAGSTFAGWSYSGQILTQDSPVASTGEHVLTALWQLAG